MSISAPPAPHDVTIATPFPVTHLDVAALSALEFTFGREALDVEHAPTFDHVCRNFVDDVNRALVWWIRFRALQAWCTRADVTAWLQTGSVTLRDACEVAAHFALNDRWEFEADSFRSAIAALTSARARG